MSDRADRTELHLSQSPWYHLSWAAASLGVATVGWLAFYPMLWAYFRHDDFGWLKVAKEWNADLTTLAYGHAGLTPVFNLLFYLGYLIGGVHSASPYFVGLITVHAVCGVLVTWLAHQLTGDLFASFIGGLCFAAMFVHHEAIGWLGGGLHPVMTLFLLLTVNLWLAAQKGSIGALVLGPCCVALTLLSKDSGVIVVPLLILLHIFSPRASSPLPWHRLGVWLVPGIAIVGLWRTFLPPHHEVIAVGGPDYWFDCRVLANLIACVPQMLVPDMNFVNYRARLAAHLPPSAIQAVVWASWALIALLFLLSLVALWKGGRLTRLAVLWCYTAFLPFTPFSYKYAIAPRYLYPASVGLALLCVLAWRRLWQQWSETSLGKSALGLGLVLAILANLAIIRMMTTSRLRDSTLRRTILQKIVEQVPAPQPGDRFYLIGLPEHLEDIALAVPLQYEIPLQAFVGPPAVPLSNNRVHVIDLSPVVESLLPQSSSRRSSQHESQPSDLSLELEGEARRPNVAVINRRVAPLFVALDSHGLSC
ncbi:MAG: hypothetical protein ACUVX8_03110 [Candidatus Zipacnadales bacterium]